MYQLGKLLLHNTTWEQVRMSIPKRALTDKARPLSRGCPEGRGLAQGHPEEAFTHQGGGEDTQSREATLNGASIQSEASLPQPACSEENHSQGWAPAGSGPRSSIGRGSEAAPRRGAPLAGGAACRAGVPPPSSRRSGEARAAPHPSSRSARQSRGPRRGQRRARGVRGHPGSDSERREGRW